MSTFRRPFLHTYLKPKWWISYLSVPASSHFLLCENHQFHETVKFAGISFAGKRWRKDVLVCVLNRFSTRIRVKWPCWRGVKSGRDASDFTHSLDITRKKKLSSYIHIQHICSERAIRFLLPPANTEISFSKDERKFSVVAKGRNVGEKFCRVSWWGVVRHKYMQRMKLYFVGGSGI